METNEISLDDLKDKAKQISRAVAKNISVNRLRIYVGTGAVVLTAVCVSYWLGRRRGRRLSR